MGQCRVEVVLDGVVDGQLEARALLGRVVRGEIRGDLPLFGVLCRDVTAGKAGEFRVVGGFETGHAFVARAGEPDDGGGEVVVGVEPGDVVFDADEPVVALVLVPELFDELLRVEVHFGFQDDVAPFFVEAVGQDLVIVDVEDGGQTGGRAFRRLLVGDLLRVDVDLPGVGALGKDVHVAVVDGPPARRDDGVGQLFRFRFPAVLLPVDETGVDHAEHPDPEAENQGEDHGDIRPILQLFVCFPCHFGSSEAPLIYDVES